ncbi:MAG: diguanylate cyclase [Desulfobacca sp.]|nr:diguanylate cyclase [Desulfobacca sp.]
MKEHAWIKEFPGAIIVCDTQGIILEMNQRAIKSYQNQGGVGLIGTNMMECHPEPAREKLKGLMERQEANVYTIEKNGSHRLIYQTPWYQEGEYAGFVEIVMTVPAEMPHFVRGS